MSLYLRCFINYVPNFCSANVDIGGNGNTGNNSDDDNGDDVDIGGNGNTGDNSDANNGDDVDIGGNTGDNSDDDGGDDGNDKRHLAYTK